MNGALRAACACVAALALVAVARGSAADQPVEASALLMLPAHGVAVVVGDGTTRALWIVELGSGEARALRWPGTHEAKKKDDEQKQAKGDDKKGEKKKTALDDIEALAPLASGSAIEFLAVTSHSRNKNGKLKPARSRIARIRLADDLRGVAAVDVYAELREPLLASLGPLLDAAARAAAAEQNGDAGGLDVEGAASWRGKLLLGLRSPADAQRRPIVAVLDDPASLFAATPSKPNFLPPLVVPARRGEVIRGMTEFGDDVLVILSERVDEKDAYRVARWNPATGAFAAIETSGIAWTQPEGIGVADGALWIAEDLPAGGKALVACRPRAGAQNAQAGEATPPACALSALLE